MRVRLAAAISDSSSAASESMPPSPRRINISDETSMSLKPPSSRCDPRMVSTAPSAISRSFDASNASDANSSVSASESASDSRRTNYARSLYLDDEVTLDDLREAVTTLEDADQIGRRVLGGAHPDVAEIAGDLRLARAVLRSRKTPPPS